MKYTKRSLAEKISALSPIQQKEILLIVKRHNVPVSTNNNGHFFDMEDVPSQCFSVIQEYVEYSIANIEQLDQYDRDIQMRKYFKANEEDVSGEHDTPEAVSHTNHKDMSGNIGNSDVNVNDNDADTDHQNNSDIISDASGALIDDIVCPPAGQAIPVKFINCKKRFNKPPRSKRYDPDDVSSLI